MSLLKHVSITAIEWEVLAAIPEGKEAAMPGGEIGALLADYGHRHSGNDVSRAVRVLKDAELVQRARMPGAPEGLGKLLQYQLVWRTPRGTKALALAQRREGSPELGQGGTVEREDVRLLDPRNRTRGAQAYRMALADCGVASPAAVLELPRKARATFEASWSAHMRALSAAAGFPIPERPEYRRQGSAE